MSVTASASYPNRRRALNVQPAHAVRLIDALGRAGRARGIDDVERPVGRDLDRPGSRPRRREPALEAAVEPLSAGRSQAISARVERVEASRNSPFGAAIARPSPRGSPGSTKARAARPRRPRATRRGMSRDIRSRTPRRSRSRSRGATPSRWRAAATRSIESVEFGVGQPTPLVGRGPPVRRASRRRGEQAGNGPEIALEPPLALHAVLPLPRGAASRSAAPRAHDPAGSARVASAEFRVS